MRKLLAFLAILSLGVALACWGLRLAGNPGGAELASGELEAEGALSPRAAELAGPRAPGQAAGAAPDWLIEATRAVLCTLWRARNKAPLGEVEPWPRRIKRWRAAPQQTPDRGAQ